MFKLKPVLNYLGAGDVELETRRAARCPSCSPPVARPEYVITSLTQRIQKLGGITMLTSTRYVVVTRQESLLTNWIASVFDINTTNGEVSLVTETIFAKNTTAYPYVATASDPEIEVVAMGSDAFVIVCPHSALVIGYFAGLVGRLCQVDADGVVTPDADYTELGLAITTSPYPFQAIESSDTEFYIPTAQPIGALNGMFVRTVTLNRTTMTLSYSDGARVMLPSDPARWQEGLYSICRNETSWKWVGKGNTNSSTDQTAFWIDPDTGALTMFADVITADKIKSNTESITEYPDLELNVQFGMENVVANTTVVTAVNSDSNDFGTVTRIAHSGTSQSFRNHVKALVSPTGKIRFASLLFIPNAIPAATGTCTLNMYKMTSGGVPTLVSTESLGGGVGLVNQSFPKLNLGDASIIPYAYQNPGGGYLVTGTISLL